MHWGSEWLPAGQGINALTVPTFDAASKQPELKHAAIRVQAANLAQHLHGFAWLPMNAAFTAHQALGELLKPLAFAAVVRVACSFDAGLSGIAIRAADHEPFGKALLATLQTVLSLNAKVGIAHYADARKHLLRVLRLNGETLAGGLITGDATACAAAAWLLPLWQQRASVKALGSALLKPSATVPVGVATASPTVCSCVGVNQSAIENGIAAAPVGCERLLHLQQTLKCGTECGSCVPQIKQMISKSTTLNL
jgi:assimilatory nitrate reductase catalytic subunit